VAFSFCTAPVEDFQESTCLSFVTIFMVQLFASFCKKQVSFLCHGMPQTGETTKFYHETHHTSLVFYVRTVRMSASCASAIYEYILRMITPMSCISRSQGTGLFRSSRNNNMYNTVNPHCCVARLVVCLCLCVCGLCPDNAAAEQ